MPPFLPSISRHNPLKYAVGKSFCSSFRHNSRNIERPWYGPWCQVLTDLTEQFDNMIVVPQFPLWFLPQDDDSDEEENSDTDMDSMDGRDYLLVSQRDGDEQSSEPGEVDDTDVGNITTDTVGTIAGSGAAELFPDFVIIHVLAKHLPVNHIRFTQLGGVVITHQCCPVILENKKAPSRSLEGMELRRGVDALLVDAQEQLGTQCYYLFMQYPHALTTIAIAAAGDYWTFRAIHRHEIPTTVGDTLVYTAWYSLRWPPYAKLSSPISDARLRQIHDTLRSKPPLALSL